MERPPEPLSPAQHTLLVEIVGRRGPELMPVVVEAVNKRWLSDEECEALAGVALAEFLDHLGPGGEPDQRGADADGLAGDLYMQRRGYWAT